MSDQDTHQSEPITEEQGIHKQWYEDAKEIDTPEKLLAFVNRLQDSYKHDYGTICHAIAAAMKATMVCFNKGPQGGITGFQAGAIQWGVLRAMGIIDFSCGVRIISYRDLLYPQYLNKFQKHRISKDNHNALIEKANKGLRSQAGAHPDVATHWEKIVSGWLPPSVVVED